MSSPVLLGLLSALGYGGTDYLSRSAGRTIGMWRSMFYGELLALILLSAWMMGKREGLPLALSGNGNAWGSAIVSAVVLMAGTVCLFRGLMVGTLAVVAPVCASYGAITAALSAASGERLPPHAFTGLAITVLGVCVVSIPARGRRPADSGSSGFGWGLAASLTFGVGFWLQGTYAVPTLGAFVPVWLYYAVGVLMLACLARHFGERLAMPKRGGFLLVAAMGALGAMGYLALTLGFATGEVAIVTVLSSLASAVTALLARVLNKAPVAAHQWLAMAGISAGLIMIKI